MGSITFLPTASSYPDVSSSHGLRDIREPFIAKPKGGASAHDRLYDGRITDAATDGSVDYQGRPANKSTTGRWTAVTFIMAAVTLERLAFYGIAFNLVSYLTKELHEGSAESVANVWIWGGVAWILPLAGGFVADAYLGRFRTIMYSLVIYLAGMVLLTVSVSLPPPECPPAKSDNCRNATGRRIGLVYLALYVIAVGAGGVKPCFSSLGADQFDEGDAAERPMKRSFFNYWWLTVTGGALLALTALVYIEDRVGFGWGYGIPTVGLAVAMGVLLAGARTYRHKRPAGSPLTQVAQVLTAAVRNRHNHVPADPGLLHEEAASAGRPEQRQLRHTNHLRFIDRAATPPPTDAATVGAPDGKDAAPLSNWKLCTVTQVEEVKLLARVMPVWFTTLIFMVTVQQMSTVFLRQGLSMDLSMGPHFKIPPASLELSCTVTALALIPLYDLYFAPLARRFTGNERGVTLLQRMGIGLVITILGMTVAALVERKRLQVVRENGMERSAEPLPMSILWLTPQYSIMGVAQVFAYMGQLEFFYDQVPDNMQTIGTALFTSNTGVSHFLCAGILHAVTSVTGRGGRRPWIVGNINESRLDKYYWMLAALSAANLAAYLAVATWYTYKTPAADRGGKAGPPEPPVVE